MFQNITLFSKQHHVFLGPGPQWTPKVRIYCTCEMNTGFSSVLQWTLQNPIKTNIYFLIVDGEVRRKHYFPGDLRPA